MPETMLEASAAEIADAPHLSLVMERNVTSETGSEKALCPLPLHLLALPGKGAGFVALMVPHVSVASPPLGERVGQMMDLALHVANSRSVRMWSASPLRLN